MDFFTKKRLATLSIVILMLLNLMTLGTIWLQRFRHPQPEQPPPHDNRPERVQRFLEKELGLTNKQAEQFKELREQHFAQSHAIRNEIHLLKKEITDELFNPAPNTEKVEKLAKEIGAKEGELEKLLFRHFQDLMSVCQQEQREKFKSLIHDLLRMIKPAELHEPLGDRPLPRGNH